MSVIVATRKVSGEVNGSIRNKAELKCERKSDHKWFINLLEPWCTFKVEITRNLILPLLTLLSTCLHNPLVFGVYDEATISPAS